MQTVTTRTFFSGLESLMPYRIEQHSAFKLPHPPKIPGLINGALVAVEIECRLRHLDKLVSIATDAYQRQAPHDYFFSVEAILLSMRRVIDDLVMSLYCRTFETDVAKTRKIAVDGYGALFKAGKPTSFGHQFLQYYVHPNEEPLEILVELSNSFKHSYLLPESRAWGVDFPTVLAIHAPRNDFSKNINYHNHSLGQLVIGFNRVIACIIERAGTHAQDT